MVGKVFARVSVRQCVCGWSRVHTSQCASVRMVGKVFARVSVRQCVRLATCTHESVCVSVFFFIKTRVVVLCTV